MKKTVISLSPLHDLDRDAAASVVRCSTGFQSSIMLRNENLVLNLKSMIGLLSRTLPEEGTAELIIEGPDEEEAFAGITETLKKLC